MTVDGQWFIDNGGVEKERGALEIVYRPLAIGHGDVEIEVRVLGLCTVQKTVFTASYFN